MHVGSNVRPGSEIGKVTDYESVYDPSEALDAEDAKRHRSSWKFYDPSELMEDSYLDLRFKELKVFKKELVEYSIRKGLEFRYIQNDAMRVRVSCSTKGSNWLILCSWCNGWKLFTVKYYVPEHS